MTVICANHDQLYAVFSREVTLEYLVENLLHKKCSADCTFTIDN